MSSEKKHYDGISILRCLACFAVVFGHAMPAALIVPPQEEALVVAYKALSSWAVPVFFIITGYLLLDRDDRIFSFYGSRLKKLLPSFLFYAAVFSLLREITNTKTVFSFFPVLKGFLLQNYQHLWFMSAMIGIYIAMPFLRKIFMHSTKQEKQVFLVIWGGLFTVLPTVTLDFGLVADVTRKYQLYPFLGFIGYVFLGGYLKTCVVSKRTKPLMYFFISTGLIVLCTLAYQAYTETATGLFYSRRSLFVFVCALSLFLMLKDMPIACCRKLILEIAGCSYGIYLLHPLYYRVFEYAFGYNTANAFSGIWIGAPVSALLIFGLSFLTIKYGRRIKYLKSVIG